MRYVNNILVTVNDEKDTGLIKDIFDTYFKEDLVHFSEVIPFYPEYIESQPNQLAHIKCYFHSVDLFNKDLFEHITKQYPQVKIRNYFNNKVKSNRLRKTNWIGGVYIHQNGVLTHEEMQKNITYYDLMDIQDNLPLI